MSRKTQRVVLKSQAREIISKVYDFMKKEATLNYAEKLSDARWRTSTACGVSERTVTRILSERKASKSNVDDSTEDRNEATTSGNPNTTIFRNPMKRRRYIPRKLNFSELDVGMIRRTIHNYHKEFNQFPTLVGLKRLFKERLQFEICLNTLRKLLHKLGYRWKKIENNKRMLIEKHEVQIARLRYLKQVKIHRKAGRPIVYTGETYVNTNIVENTTKASGNYSKIDNQPNSAKEVRMIIVHAGSAAGFIPNALLIFRAEVKTGDYHDNMTSENYLMWLREKLIPNLPKDATIVMVNAPYHNASSEKPPPLNSDKSTLVAWLTSKNIPFDENSERLELYDLIQKNKDRFRTYRVDDLLKEHGFSVLRLPPNHADLNPIENIWDKAKNYYVNLHLDQFSYSNIDTLNEAFNSIGDDVWHTTCRHVEKLEDQYMSNCDLDCYSVINEGESSDSETDIFASSEESE